jgi:DNA-3-methyladenine glycosylase II
MDTALTRRLTYATLRAATDELCARDADLAGVVQRFGRPPLWGRRPGFAALVRIILEQQVSLAAARTMYERLRRHTGAVTPEAISRFGIPRLRRLGFTRQKSAYCHELARSVHRGQLDLRAVARADDETGREILQGVRGLGPWSADIYLLMALRRPDIWPRGDLALADAAFRVKRLRSRPDAATLARLAAPWAPWRSVAARVLWHYYLSTRSSGTRSS